MPTLSRGCMVEFVLWTLLGTALLQCLVGNAQAAGTITLSQDAFTVQEKADFSWIYTVDEGGLDEGDRFLIYDPVFQGMRWSKWGDLSPWWDRCTPQTTAQQASWGLVSVHARRDDVRLEDVTVLVSRSNCTDVDMSCSSAIHDRAWTEVEIMEGSLVDGDEVVVGIGDVGACEASCTDSDCGSCTDCGFEMSDRAFPEVAWPVEFCPADEDCEALESPLFSIDALSTADSLLATLPSQALAGEAIRLKVALLDRWGNAVDATAQTLTVHAPAGVQTYTFGEDDSRWHDFEVVLHEPGIHRIEVTAGALGGWSNPVEVLEEAPEERIFWGDIHVHHGYTWVDADGGTHDLNHVYGRDVVGLDIVSQSQKAEGIELGETHLWAELQNSCRAYSEVDQYLVLLGFEWMGEPAAEEFGTPSEGHHNVYYDGCEAPLGTHDVDIIDSLGGERGLWAWLDDVEVEYGVRGVTIPHAMRWTGYNFSVRNPGTQTLVEVYSEWGNNTEWVSGQTDADVPGSTQDLMNSGLRLGWLGGSDNHDGWMGNPYSEKNEKSGLGAFVATRLSRPAVFKAMQQRRTYATSGHRPILRFRAEDGEHLLPQGTEYISRSPTLRWRYHGTAEVERVRLFRIRIQEGAPQELFQEWTGDGLDMSGSLDLGPLTGTSVAYWLEVRQWDGEVAWSSPIWLTNECDRRVRGAEDPFGRCQDRDTGGAMADESKPVRCACTQGGGGGWLWLFATGLALIRRDERSSPGRARG